MYDPDDLNLPPCCEWLETQISGQCGLEQNRCLRLTCAIVLLLLMWALLFTILGHEVTPPSGNLFQLIVLTLIAYICGQVVALCHLPPLLGMMIAGIALRSCGFFNVYGVYQEIVAKIREIALTVILIKAGLGLDGPALLKLSFVVIRLAFVPCVAETVGAAIITHYLLGWSWLWGLLLGFMLGAVTPAVVVPALLALKERGYGEDKGISTLVIAAASLDDILAISAFGVCLGMIFLEGDIVSKLLQGPIEMVLGLTLGIVGGTTVGFIPHKDDKYIIWKRSALIGIGSLCFVLGSELLHYPGAGPFACIVATFIANQCWKIQGWSNTYNPVSKVFTKVWLVLQPMLFGLIGAEIDVRTLEGSVVGEGVVVLLGAILFRTIFCSIALLGANLNWKEILFVNIAWLPKATVQAALGPVALDMARKLEEPNPDYLDKGSKVLTFAVLSILITAPLGAIGITLTGPVLLSNEGFLAPVYSHRGQSFTVAWEDVSHQDIVV